MANNDGWPRVPFEAPAVIPPVYPDFYSCFQLVGEDPVYEACARAAAKLNRSPQERQFYLRDPNQRWVLPITYQVGPCQVSAEVAGPSFPQTVNLAPAQLSGMAGFVLQNCVQYTLGGFATYRFSNMLRHITNPAIRLTDPFPPWSYFITVSITHARTGLPSPGNYDSAIPIATSMNLNSLFQRAWGNPLLQQSFYSMQRFYRDQAIQMEQGVLGPWWEYTTKVDDEMTYTCDSQLGSPSAIDCIKLMSQLPYASDNVALGPGTVRFLSLNTCHLAISATIAIVLSWVQIHAALTSLMKICVSHPFGGPQGGRAHYGAPPAKISRRKRREPRTVSGLNALPDHVNLTIFQQLEPWQPDAAKEMQTCTWKAISEGKNVQTCQTA